MKDLIVSEDAKIFAPDKDNDVEICTNGVSGYEGSCFVPFEKLEEWVAHIREQKNHIAGTQNLGVLESNRPTKYKETDK